jgi:hypothetical protein
MSLYDEFQSTIDNIIGEYKKVIADGKISISEVFTAVSNATATFVQLFRTIGVGSEVERKDAVLKAIGRFYDEVIAPIDIVGVPNFLEGVVDKAIKELLLLLAKSWIDSLVNIFTKSELMLRQELKAAPDFTAVASECDCSSMAECTEHRSEKLDSVVIY